MGFPAGVRSTVALNWATATPSYSYSTGYGWSTPCETISETPSLAVLGSTPRGPRARRVNGSAGKCLRTSDATALAAFILSAYLFETLRLKMVGRASSWRETPSPDDMMMSMQYTLAFSIANGLGASSILCLQAKQLAPSTTHRSTSCERMPVMGATLKSAATRSMTWVISGLCWPATSMRIAA
eukprot:Amastigsp_a510841_157.p2 type:complete len:184 gc:universal Amastigsp_a510841_157:139-690(+)